MILTPDDIGFAAKEPDKARKRARQNVILELGLFIGKLGRKRVCPIYVGDLELPSDIHGCLYIGYDEEGKVAISIAERNHCCRYGNHFTRA